MAPEILNYNEAREPSDKEICDLLSGEIDRYLTGADSKVWHANPVWFLDGNPIVGYSKQKRGIRLMFWSGADFEEEGLNEVGKKFKDASVFYLDISQVNKTALRRWLKKSKVIQWDYKNIVRRKGKLVRINEDRNMKTTREHDEKIAKMTFSSVYPHYVTKVEKKERTKEELHQVIEWLTGYKAKDLKRLIEDKVTFEQFFAKAKLNANAHLITGMICGYRIEEIENPLTQQVRYLDKLVDELAKGRKMEKILRVE